MGKKIAIGVGAVVVLIAAGLFFLTSNLDGIVKNLVEKYGSEATGTEVALGSVDLDLTGGSVTIGELSVGNPAGFKTTHAFKMKNISVTLDAEKSTRDLIVIKEILIDNPQVIYEQVGKSSNIDKIKKNASGDGQASDEAEGAYSGPKIIIETLTFTGGTVEVSAEGVLKEDLATDLPAFTLRDLGKAQGGATPNEIAVEITKKLSSVAMDAAAKKGVQGVLDKVMDGAGDTFKDVKEGIGGLFGGKKDEEK
ncbi:MAG: hypothetical protein EP340_01660 [Alphaproteobacteria bacterium]|nr:MAG: hypothetical protein EP340_01660 [Alphaproteobacteria bacterium]